MKSITFLKKNLQLAIVPGLLLMMHFFTPSLHAQGNNDQAKTYASSQSYLVSGICVACSVQNPALAVGSDESDYSKLFMGLQLFGRIEQTLIFPDTMFSNFTKIVLGVGTEHTPISIRLLGNVRIETFLGGVSNNDSRVIDSNVLVVSADSTRSTIELSPAKPYDRIKVSLNGGLVGISDEFRIYYTYHVYLPFTSCGSPPLNPLFYFPLDGTLEDLITGTNMSGAGNVYEDSSLCNQGLNSFVNYDRGCGIAVPFKGIKPKSFSIWIRVNPRDAPHIQSLHLEIFDVQLHMKGLLTILAEGEALIDDHYQGGISFVNTTDFMNIVGTYTDTSMKLYLNGELQGETDEGPDKIPVNDYYIRLRYQRMAIDEFIIYDRELTPTDIQALWCSYGMDSSCQNQNATAFSYSNSGKESSTIHTLDIYPNPNNGTLSINNKVSMAGAIFSVHNMMGQRVYQTSPVSNNIVLPSSLSAGVYVIELQTKEKKYRSKMVLKK